MKFKAEVHGPKGVRFCVRIEIFASFKFYHIQILTPIFPKQIRLFNTYMESHKMNLLYSSQQDYSIS